MNLQFSAPLVCLFFASSAV